MTFFNLFLFCGEKFLATCPTPRLEGNPKLAIHDSICDMQLHHSVVTSLLPLEIQIKVFNVFKGTSY
jgi:hypothetical protein